MWGSSFAELAKKAQEQANSLSMQTDMFSLDGLMESNKVKDGETESTTNINQETKVESEKEVSLNPRSIAGAFLDVNALKTSDGEKSEEIEGGSSKEENLDSEKSPEAETKNPNELQHTEMKETQINPIDTTEKVNSVAIHEKALDSKEEDKVLNASIAEKSQEGKVNKMSTTSAKTPPLLPTQSDSSGQSQQKEESPPKEIEADETTSSIDTPPGISPTVKSMIDSTAKIFDSSSSTKAENESSAVYSSSASLDRDDGLSEEERNLESVSMKLSMEFNQNDNVMEQIEMKNTSENKTQTQSENGAYQSDEDSNDNCGEVNHGWTNVVASEEEDTVDAKILDETPLSEEVKTEVTSFPDEDDDYLDESSPHSSEILVERLDDENEQESIEKNEPLNESTQEIKDDIKHDGIPKDTNEPQVTAKPSSSHEIPQFALEKFMEQIQRLDENHQIEIQELKRSHKRELEEAASSGNNDVDKEQLEQYSVQLNELKNLLREKDEETRKREEDFFNLRREVERGEFKCEKLEKQMQKNKKSSEEQSKKLMEEIASLKSDLDHSETMKEELESALADANSATAASEEQYAALKTRVKSVATELKERRAECRDFDEQRIDLENEISTLMSEKSKLVSELEEIKNCCTEKDTYIDDLKSQNQKLESNLSSIKAKKQKDEQKGDSAMKTYKVKAQNALAAANSRAAAAIQAREEMLIECQGAKQAILDAEKKARSALSEKIETEKKSKEEIASMEREIEEFCVKIAEMEKKVSEADSRASEMEKAIEVSTIEQHKLYDEMEKVEVEMEKEKQVNADLHTKHVEEKQRAEKLMKEVLELREIQKRSSTEAFMAKKKEQNEMQTVERYDRSSTTRASAMSSSRKNEAERTVTMLQEELIDANETIRELREALREISYEENAEETNSLESNKEISNDSLKHSEEGGATTPVGNNATIVKQSTSNSDTPLFYALEKQAELNIAREEINRLANVLGDAEAARMEAVEERDMMKRRMEEAEARVLRQEKFVNSSENKDGAKMLSNSGHKAANVNLEYLKNVILQYLNATTVAQRKSLIPVVGAVLCLTPDEQRDAVTALENSSGLQNVGTSLIEGLETSLFGLYGTARANT